ncbi:HNH endonuclease [Rhodococcus phage Finch]|uniref:HNH endonuclease n=1 Tax=Rhodococcus phage Finch TaxID=2094144 RepID=A0A2P1JXM3_9CAUD|nr:HNH endonuclease [Rhodococcus phage Finch]AVO25111.1 HNH endonuclease [Rhodococcus phage Finch]
MTDEQWASIPDWEGFYEASDQGRVRSLDRWVPSNTGRRYQLGALMRPTKHGKGGPYLAVHLSKHGKSQVRKVHVLVMEAFVGPCPPRLEVCHRNGDGHDNRLENLQYGTRSKNALDAVQHGTHAHAAKTECPQGHEYNEANTNHSGGRRKCRTCHRLRARAHRANLKE